MVKKVCCVFSALLLASCARNGPDAAQQRRLQVLDESLRQACALADKENRRTLTDLHKLTTSIRMGDSEQKQALNLLVAHSDTISAISAKLVTDIQRARRQLRLCTSGSEKPSAALMMLGSQQNGLAYRVLRQFAAYRATLRALDTTVALPRLAPRQLAADSSAPAIAGFYFQDATTAEALAGLTQLEAQVLAHEAAALRAQASRIGCGGTRIYNAIWVSAPAESSTVAAGTTYHAALFLASVVRPAVLQMRVNGNPIAVSEPGIGRVSFVADPRKLGTSKQVEAAWEGTIRASTAYTKSGDTIFRVRVPYRIVRGK